MHIVVKFLINEDKYAAFVDSVKKMVAETNQEKGCVFYNYHSDKQNPLKVVLIEEWASQHYLEQHLQSTHIKEWNALNKKEGFTAAPPDIMVCGGPLIKV